MGQAAITNKEVAYFSFLILLLSGGIAYFCPPATECASSLKSIFYPPKPAPILQGDCPFRENDIRPRPDNTKAIAAPTKDRRPPPKPGEPPRTPRHVFPNNDEGRTQYFEFIFNTGYWGSGKPGERPKSGQGATMVATEKIRKNLKDFLVDMEIFDMIDVGCGDVSWITKVMPTVPTLYLGIDIVDGLIQEALARQYESHMEFQTLDAVKGPIPQKDLIFTRNMLPHMLSDAVLNTLKQFSNSGAKWLVATTFPKVEKNWDTTNWKYEIGRTYFYWNLEIAPFNLGPPTTYLNDTWDESPLGLWSLPLWIRGASKEQLLKWPDTAEGRKAVMDTIYETKHWGTKKDPSSGQGSSIQNTAEIRDALIDFIKSNNVKSMIDVPCGDLTWMPLMLDQVEVDYLGVDIVRALIDKVNVKHEGPRRQFKVADAVEEILPRVDLIFCREMLQHLLRDSAYKVIQNFIQSGSTYFAATTFVDVTDNWDTTAMNKRIDVFVYWPWNLEIAPFNLGPPVTYLKDSYDSAPMGVWLINKPQPEPPIITDVPRGEYTDTTDTTLGEHLDPVVEEKVAKDSTDSAAAVEEEKPTTEPPTEKPINEAAEPADKPKVEEAAPAKEAEPEEEKHAEEPVKEAAEAEDKPKAEEAALVKEAEPEEEKVAEKPPAEEPVEKTVKPEDKPKAEEAARAKEPEPEEEKAAEEPPAEEPVNKADEPENKPKAEEEAAEPVPPKVDEPETVPGDYTDAADPVSDAIPAQEERVNIENVAVEDVPPQIDSNAAPGDSTDTAETVSKEEPAVNEAEVPPDVDAGVADAAAGKPEVDVEGQPPAVEKAKEDDSAKGAQEATKKKKKKKKKKKVPAAP